MTDTFSCMQCPYFIFRCEDILNFKGDSKMSKVDNVPFTVTLKRELSENDSTEYIKMFVENVPRKKGELTAKTIMMTADAYVKSNVLAMSKETRFFRTNPVYLPSNDPKYKVLEIKVKTFLECLDSYRQTDGGVYFVCLLKPRQKLKNCYPQIMLPNEDYSSNKEMETRICWNSFDALSSDFGSLLDKSKGDFLLKSGCFQSYVHRIIISKRCPKFEEKLYELTQLDPPANEMNVTDLDVNTLDILLKYIYYGRIPAISASDAQKLLVFGLNYAMTDLTDLCAEIIMDNVTKENVLDFLVLADKHKHDKLKSCMTDYILSNNILKSKRWLRFCANMKIALEVYRENVAKSYSSDI